MVIMITMLVTSRKFIGGGYASPTNLDNGRNIKRKANYTGNPSDEPTSDKKCMIAWPWIDHK